MTNTIVHYGVKRKSGRYPWGSGERPYQNSPNPNLRTAVRKGEYVQNVSNRPRELKNAPIYISYTDADNKFYRTHHISGQYFRYGDDKAFINKMKAKKDIRVPTGQEVLRIYDKAYSNNRESVIRTLKEKTKPEYFQTILRIFENGYFTEQDFEKYLDAMPRMMYYNENFRKDVIKELKRIGANAIKDYEDFHGTDKWTSSKSRVDDPLIIVEGKKMLEQMSSTMITKFDFNYNF